MTATLYASEGLTSALAEVGQFPAVFARPLDSDGTAASGSRPSPPCCSSMCSTSAHSPRSAAPSHSPSSCSSESPPSVCARPSPLTCRSCSPASSSRRGARLFRRGHLQQRPTGVLDHGHPARPGARTRHGLEGTQKGGDTRHRRGGAAPGLTLRAAGRSERWSGNSCLARRQASSTVTSSTVGRERLDQVVAGCGGLVVGDHRRCRLSSLPLQSRLPSRSEPPFLHRARCRPCPP